MGGGGACDSPSPSASGTPAWLPSSHLLCSPCAGSLSTCSSCSDPHSGLRGAAPPRAHSGPARASIQPSRAGKLGKRTGLVEKTGPFDWNTGPLEGTAGDNGLGQLGGGAGTLCLQTLQPVRSKEVCRDSSAWRASEGATWPGLSCSAERLPARLPHPPGQGPRAHVCRPRTGAALTHTPPVCS